MDEAPTRADSSRRLFRRRAKRARRYDAFISYSHAASGAFAPALQDGLKRLARPWHRTRALEIFRDSTGLSVSPGLVTSIRDALDNAEYFVLLASPEAAASEWVGSEIRHWRETRDSASIVPVLTAGTWQWDVTDAEFDWEQSTAVHPALAGAFTDAPRVIDMTWANDENALSLELPRFRTAIAEIAAPMHGLTPEELIRTDTSRRRQRRHLVFRTAMALIVLTVTAVVAGVVAVVNQRQASAQRDRAELNREAAERRAREETSLTLAAQALDRARGRGDLSLLLAAQAENFATTAQSLAALETLVASDVSRYLHGGSAGIVDIDLTADGSRVAAVDGGGALLAWDAMTGLLLFDPLPGEFGNVAWSGDGSVLMAASYNSQISFFDDSGNLVEPPLVTGHVPTVSASPGEGPLGGGCFRLSDLIPASCLPSGSLQVQADIDPTGELVLIHQPTTDLLEVWDRTIGQRIWTAPRSTGDERFENRSGAVVLPLMLVDPRTGMQTPRPERTDTQLCANVNSFTGPQIYDSATLRWGVVDQRSVSVVHYLPAQGPAENANLRCLPTFDDAGERAFRWLDVTLTSEARTIAFAAGRIAIGTDQDPVVLIAVDEPSVVGTGDIDLVKRACEIAGRNLTTVEWNQFLPEWEMEPTCEPSIGSARETVSTADLGSE